MKITFTQPPKIYILKYLHCSDKLRALLAQIKKNTKD
jgi:hypothetical protein